MNSIGEMLKAILKRKGLSQTELADKIGVKPQSVNQWIKGETNPGRKNLIVLSEVLGITVNELISGKLLEELPIEEKTKETTTPQAAQKDLPADHVLVTTQELIDMQRKISDLQTELLKMKEKEIERQQKEIERQRLMHPDQGAT